MIASDKRSPRVAARHLACRGSRFCKPNSRLNERSERLSAPKSPARCPRSWPASSRPAGSCSSMLLHRYIIPPINYMPARVPARQAAVNFSQALSDIHLAECCTLLGSAFGSRVPSSSPEVTLTCPVRPPTSRIFLGSVSEGPPGSALGSEGAFFAQRARHRSICRA